MTSKEALDNLYEFAVSSEPMEMVIKEYKEIILKHLDVLDILKRNVGIRLAIQEWVNKETNIFPNDRKIVKQWLEGENNEKSK